LWRDLLSIIRCHVKWFETAPRPVRVINWDDAAGGMVTSAGGNHHYEGRDQRRSSPLHIEDLSAEC
jgi:hypothetical protein